ncbi:aminoacyl-tRNA hydrolase [Denitrobaculum tricleocarpae]|uniref:Peptidyl-tRNA hydrolase n=1 Tax=Denitrobaculum tricleocarpae TaxID=2591009 RepID=A0A545U283_9PROT|nr:aminoacyl-tRNA hydrolase [Denitrobaculum tricleocarpae]TQV83544.1 aminoacyl-tRNA hydrolase [Denitrobaculum tricleocarpae]
MLLLVGLGNPGQRYANNRHNIGFMAVDEMVRRHSFGPWRSKFQGQICEGRIGREKVLILKPETFMNESGRAVGEAIRFYKLETEQVFVVYDEIDLVPGKIKVKKGGGAGGHNGLRSIDAHIGQDYWRVRLGVGHPGDKNLVHSHVLGDFSKADTLWRDKLLDAVAAEISLLLAGESGSFMSRVAQVMNPPRPKPPKPSISPKPTEASAEGVEERHNGPQSKPETHNEPTSKP